ncbi:nucleotidyltransferase family protein [Streptomyces sp. NPDC002896]|uniref:nucleotidyltransferase family protein n=1 Tax=Streptomyces sp. NPDC002896 TaxID=3154438 RepID=UPI00331AA4D1
MTGRLPLDEQLSAFQAALSRNDVLLEVLHRTAAMRLPGWYLTAGCLFQTVWNVVTGQPPTAGIKDYDVFYFDDGDLSWKAEDAVIRTGQEAFGDLLAQVEIRNEARVHLWYEQKFGVPCAPHTSTESAIDCFAATTCCLGVRLEPDGRWRVYAPHGLADVFNLVIRPNPVLAPREVYETKAARWRQQWPGLTVLDWPGAV